MEQDFSSLRQAAGLTIKEAAEELGVSTSTAYRYESGESSPRQSELRALHGLGLARPKAKKNAPPADGWFSFIDLFAGIGGLRRGFEAIGGKCVFTSEWDKYSQATYRANFKCDHDIAGDIRQVKSEEIPKHDVLLAGFPCQPFSIAGVSKKNALGRPHGFACEAQGTLFYEVARIIEHHKPAAFLLENVKNLVSHDRGNTFKVIVDVLQKQLGYHIQYRVIDALHFLPQHRERIIIVGFREDSGFDISSLGLPEKANVARLGSILHPENGEEAPDPHGYTIGNIGSVSPKYTLTDHLWKYLQAYAEKHKAKGNGFGCSVVGPEDTARTLSARYYKDGSEILVEQKGRNPRRLTPRECARLMGFEERRGADFKIPVSDTQAYRQFGNSVAVPVIEAVARHMKSCLQDVLAPKKAKRVA
ncbi:MAG: DNA (cytosine-5-)-methyltransferase [Alphaproteobacteria bacterium]|nr:DNA (cytosine-5-)-methyltransferase [Alphaproteobacteria bacterium]